MVTIDTESLKEEALDSLLATLDAIRGRKCLVIDRSLSSTLSLIASFSTLHEHGVEKMFWLQSPSLVSLISSFSSASSSPSSPAIKYVTFLVPTASSPKSASLVATAAQELLALQDSPFELSLIQVPERTPDFTSILENAGVLGDISIFTWPIYFVPLAPDFLSLNLPNGGGYKDAFIHNTPSTVNQAASAIQDIQQRYGLIGRITGKGKMAQDLVDILLRKREERQTNLSEAVTSQTTQPTASDIFDHQYTNIFTGKNIDQLIAIDRQSDPLTPMLTQLTYEGLIEEFYGITESGQVELPSNIVSPSSQNTTTGGSGSSTNNNTPNNISTTNNNNNSNNSAHDHTDPTLGVSVESKKVILGGENDHLFDTIRDANFSTVGHTLNKVARQLQSDYESRHEAKTVNQIKAFVGKLGGLQSLHQVLRFHTALAEDLMNTLQEEEFNKWLEIQQNLVADTLDLTQIHTMIEDLIDRSSSMFMVLRLLCIDSICNGGIKEKELSHFKREFVQTYGYQHINTFETLESLGLLFPRHPNKPNWFPTIRKQLNIISDQQDDVDPRDIAFTYSGYAPLSVRIVQSAIDKEAIPALSSARNRRSLVPTINNSTPTVVPWKIVGWKGAEGILKNIPGPRVDEVQHDDTFLREGKLRKILARNSQNSSSSSSSGSSKSKATIIILYIGGITYAEVAALRFLSEKSNDFNLVIATTGLISGDKIINSASE